MHTVQRIPNIRSLVDQILGASYADYNCYGLVRYLLKAGFALDLDADPHQAANAIVEVWYRGDTRDPLTLIRPWDCFILACKGFASDHLGLIVDARTFVHTRPRTGVVLEPIQRWQAKLLQIARLRILA
jgi:hypothetical protein